MARVATSALLPQAYYKRVRTNDLKHETTIRETVVGNEYFPRSARAGAELIGAESQKNEQYKTAGKEGNNFRPWPGIEPPRPEL